MQGIVKPRLGASIFSLLPACFGQSKFDEVGKIACVYDDITQSIYQKQKQNKMNGGSTLWQFQHKIKV